MSNVGPVAAALITASSGGVIGGLVFLGKQVVAWVREDRDAKADMREALRGRDADPNTGQDAQPGLIDKVRDVQQEVRDVQKHLNDDQTEGTLAATLRRVEGNTKMLQAIQEQRADEDARWRDSFQAEVRHDLAGVRGAIELGFADNDHRWTELRDELARHDIVIPLYALPAAIALLKDRTEPGGPT